MKTNCTYFLQFPDIFIPFLSVPSALKEYIYIYIYFPAVVLFLCSRECMCGVRNFHFSWLFGGFWYHWREEANAEIDCWESTASWVNAKCTEQQDKAFLDRSLSKAAAFLKREIGHFNSYVYKASTGLMPWGKKCPLNGNFSRMPVITRLGSETMWLIVS